MMLDPRLLVDVQPAIFQIVELPNTNRTPPNISLRKPLRPASLAGCGAGSGLRIHHKERTDTRNDSASAMTARAAPSTWIKRPAIAGPAICATEPVTCSLLLPSTRSERAIKAGRKDG